MVNRSRGRRPGESTTRDEILAAARRQFAERGYARSSVRAIARDAGVDARLVGHWFGGKADLFGASVELPFDPEEIAARVADGPVDQVGRRLAAAVVLGVLEDPIARGRGIALVRAVATEPQVVPVLRDLLMTEVLTPVAVAIGADHAPTRAALVASQMIGMLMMRHVVEIDPLVEIDAAHLVEVLAPTLQRYLTAPLPLG